MTCADCLSALATESLRDISPDSPVLQHCATCPDCARVTTTLREKEYEAATLLNGLPPMSNPLTVAETAVRTAQRRRVGRVVVMLSGAALAATIWIAAATTIIPALNLADLRTVGAQRTETIPLTCLSPQQAGDIINPYVRTHGSNYWVPASGISAITVKGTAAELAKSRDLIREFENDPSAACRLPMTIIRRVQEQVSGGQARSGNEPAAEAGKATTAPKKQ
jgi:hypothetical protein